MGSGAFLCTEPGSNSCLDPENIQFNLYCAVQTLCFHWSILIRTFCFLFSEVGPPKNLVTSDVTDTSFAASWTAAPGNVKAYQVQWQSPFSDEFGEKTVPGDSTSTVLDGLTPETLYKVSVVAAYDRKNSDPLTGQETTDGKTAESWRRSADAQQTKQRFSRIKRLMPVSR